MPCLARIEDDQIFGQPIFDLPEEQITATFAKSGVDVLLVSASATLYTGLGVRVSV